MITVETTDVFKQDLLKWLEESCEDKYSLPFAKFKEELKEEMLDDLGAFARAFVLGADKYQHTAANPIVLSLSLKENWRTKKYQKFILRAEHFKVTAFNPFTHAIQEIKL